MNSVNVFPLRGCLNVIKQVALAYFIEKGYMEFRVYNPSTSFFSFVSRITGAPKTACHNIESRNIKRKKNQQGSIHFALS